MPKILVTGGAGYIGSITAYHLLERGFEVAGDRRPFAGPSRECRAGAAARVAPAGYRRRRCAAQRRGCGGAFRGATARWANRCASRSCIFQTTSAERFRCWRRWRATGSGGWCFRRRRRFMANPEKMPIPEDARIAPVNPYGESKAIVEKILRELDHYRGLAQRGAAVLQRLRGGAGRGVRRGAQSGDASDSAAVQGRGDRANRCRFSATITRRRMGPASATTFM